MKWQPKPGYTIDWARERAEELFGSMGIARWIPGLPPGKRCAVLIRFKDPEDGPWKYGIVGAANDWATAIAGAKKYAEAAEAAMAADALEPGHEGPKSATDATAPSEAL